MSGKATFNLDTSAFEQALGQWEADVTHELATAMYEESELIMTDSKENYCPVDTGVLRSSGHVELPERSGDTITVEFGYGGAAEPYALEQHENLSYHHTVGQAKYLEVPALAAQKGLADRIARRLARFQ